MKRPDITTNFADCVYVGENTTVKDVLEYIEYLENIILEEQNDIPLTKEIIDLMDSIDDGILDDLVFIEVDDIIDFKSSKRTSLPPVKYKKVN